jgi:hypothetical protein
VDEAYPHLQMDEAEWADTFEQEHDNLRAVLDRLSAAGDTQRALETAGRLYRFWYLKSHLKEGQRRLEEALRADERPTAARALALDGAAVMALNLGGPSIGAPTGRGSSGDLPGGRWPVGRGLLEHDGWQRHR